MRSIEWWPKLDSDAQARLVAHNGEAVSSEVLGKIVTANGSVTSSAWWIGAGASDGFHLSDEAVDWIEAEAEANGEHDDSAP